jgi:uncharacterized repeat protein (TIGR01451 family)
LPVATADLRVTKSVDRSQITVDPSSNARQRLTYTIDVTNGGPATATDVVVTDTLPSGTEFVSAVPSVGTCSRSGATLTCALGTLANGATAQIVVTVAVPPTHPGGTLTNQVDVSSSTPDPDLTNNRDDASIRVVSPGVVPAPAPPPPAPPGGAGDRLPPVTGAQIGGFLLLAAILICAGRLLVSLARRRGHAT